MARRVPTPRPAAPLFAADRYRRGRIVRLDLRTELGAAPERPIDRLVTQTPRTFSHLARIAALVALGDYATKEAASRFVGGSPTVFSDWLQFAVVHNPVGAFGLSLGAYTWQLNLALTLATIALVVPVSRDLGRVDPLAPRALGLVVGGALGNFASLVLSPHGVVDFIALTLPGGTELVLNVADVAAYAGLAMILRTGFLIVAEMRRTTQPVMPAVAGVQPAPGLSARFADREVRRSVYREGVSPELDIEELPARDERPTPVIDSEPVAPPTRVLPFPTPRERDQSGERLRTHPPREGGRFGRRP